MTWFLAILALGFLVTIHEFGHFLVAKWSGMRVDVFSIGFGPAIPHLEWRWGETRFQVAWIPLGGYVKIAGSNPYDEEDYREDDPTAFLNQPVLKRMAVVVAGPGINYLFAWVMAIILFGFKGVPVQPEHYPLVLSQVAKARPAAKAGLRQGDRIVAVDGKTVDSYQAYRAIVVDYLRGCRHVPEDQRVVHLEVLRGTKQLELEWHLASQPQTLDLTVASGRSSLAGLYVPMARGLWVTGIGRTDLLRAGLRPGDRIVSADGVSVASMADLRKRFAAARRGLSCPAHMEKLLVLTVRRGDKRLDVKVYPDRSGLIGVVFEQATEWMKVPLGERLKLAMEYPVVKSKEMLVGIGQMLSGLWHRPSATASQVAGPVGIVVVVKTRMRQGFVYGLSVVMYLSVMLGLFNILPLPALDGGHFVFRLMEFVTRRRLAPTTEAKVHYFVLLLLFALMILVTVKDCRGLFGL